ncbi:MAG: hypothetical protein JW991_05510 [Candidatus Pacebacteria bacterium]|nr:hypothetical protein [Candidatus Paceibacterota bacterium]
MKTKKIILIIVVFLFLASVPLAIYLVRQRQEIRMRAAPASTISFSPGSLNVFPGDSFVLDAVLETGANVVPAVELHVSFDPEVFEINSLSAGSDLATVFDGPTIDNQAGIAFLVVGDVESPIEGIGTVATIGFDVKGPSQGVVEEIVFSSETQAGAWGEEGQNVLVDTSPALVTIVSTGGSEGPTATPTPASVPTSTPTSGLVPTATPTFYPTSTPTWSPTATPNSYEYLPTSTPAVASPAPPVTGFAWPTVIFVGLATGFFLIGFLGLT